MILEILPPQMSMTFVPLCRFYRSAYVAQYKRHAQDKITGAGTSEVKTWILKGNILESNQYRHANQYARSDKAISLFVTIT